MAQLVDLSGQAIASSSRVLRRNALRDAAARRPDEFPAVLSRYLLSDRDDFKGWLDAEAARPTMAHHVLNSVCNVMAQDIIELVKRVGDGEAGAALHFLQQLGELVRQEIEPVDADEELEDEEADANG